MATTCCGWSPNSCTPPRPPDRRSVRTGQPAGRLPGDRDRYRRAVVTDAGAFADWVVAMQAGLRDGTGSDVPCGDCVACCTSGQTILVDADEVDALRHLPAEARSPLADGSGDHVLVRDDGGRCVLLVDGSCTVYEHRPRRCRTYDCRIFAATGLRPEDDKPAIATRAADWRFRYDRESDRRRQQATILAVTALRHVELGGRPTSATQLAAAAVLAHDEFLRVD